MKGHENGRSKADIASVAPPGCNLLMNTKALSLQAQINIDASAKKGKKRQTNWIVETGVYVCI